MLWSLSGNISMVYKVLFGIDMEEDALILKPFVPKILAGERSLNNFKYRNALLDIALSGYGNQIKTITLDGSPLPSAKIPASLSGQHKVVIVLADNDLGEGMIGQVKDYFSVAAPVVKLTDGQLNWNEVEGAETYRLLRNGKEIARISELTYAVKADGEYQVIAEDKNQVPSFASEPVLNMQQEQPQIFFIDEAVEKSNLPYQGYSGKGFAEISKTKNKKIMLTVNITEAGTYALDFRYANGNGPTNTENKCAIRTFTIDGSFAGTFVFPQRGKDEWSDWGFSNTNEALLDKGTHQLHLIYEEWNENMNGEINQAMLDYLRIIRLK